MSKLSQHCSGSNCSADEGNWCSCTIRCKMNKVSQHCHCSCMTEEVNKRPCKIGKRRQCHSGSDCSADEGNRCSSSIHCKINEISQRCCCDSGCMTEQVNKKPCKMDKPSQHRSGSDYSMEGGHQYLRENHRKMNEASQYNGYDSDSTIEKVNQSRYSNDYKAENGFGSPTLSRSTTPKRKIKKQEIWEEYIDKKVIRTGCVDEVALCSLDGKLLAKIGLDGLTQQEVKQLLIYLKKPQDSFRTGFDVCGKKYLYLSGSTNILRGRDIDDERGVIVTKGKHTVLVGLSKNVPHLGECDYVLDKQMAYLEMVGY